MIFFFLKFCFCKHGIFLLAFQFINAVEEMELAILVPQSLQDMSLSNNGHDGGNGVVLEKSLLEAFTVLRNIKNVITGKINSAPFLYELHGGFIF